MSRKNEQFKARDKKTHKMTRDGLVEVNQTTGTEQRVSQRGQEFELKRQAPAGQEAFTLSAFSGDSVRRHQRTASVRQEAPATGETPPQTVSRDTATDRQYSAEHSYSSDNGIRQMEAAASQDGQFHPVPVQPDGGRLPDTPLRAAPRSGNMQTAATVAATQGGRRHKPIQSQADAHRKTAAEGPTAPRQDAPPESPRAPAYRAETTQNSTQTDTAPQAAEHPSRLRFGETEQTPKGRDASVRQHGTRYQQKFAAEANQGGAGAATERPQADTAAADQRPVGERLQFSPDERPPEALGEKLTQSRRSASDRNAERKLNKATLKSEKITGRLEQAREKLPVKRKLRANRVLNEKTGEVKRKIRFEKEVKSQGEHLRGPLPLRPFKAGGNAAVGYAHKKLFQVEQENVGVKAAHRTELAAEGLARSALRFQKTRPYRRVARLERLERKAQVTLSYRKALNENPTLRSNLLSRFLQKQKIKRQYAKAAREAKRAAGNAKKAASATGKLARALGGFIRRHPVLTLSIALLLLLLFFIMTAFSSCTNMAGGGLSAIFMSSYTAPDKDIDDAALAYSEWETDLQFQIDNTERDHPGYDEYRYNVDDISHNPYELMAYLTAKYHDFTFAQVRSDLWEIFSQQYTLTFEPEVEIRYRTETRTDTWTDEEGNTHTDTYEVEVPYEWHILNISLTARSFTDIVAGRMDGDQREHYGLLMNTGGNRQYALSPFDFDWHPFISCYYGWRVHPITGAKDNHRGIDIAVAQGTEIRAAHDGTVTTATWHSSYGNYLALDDGKGLVTKYAHCSQLLVSTGQTVKKGDVIARVGNTGSSTGPHLHFEVIKDGQYLNPLFFTETVGGGTPGAAPGTPGGPVIPDYPGEPMGDGSYAALMEEAQKHLGKPYVFGAKGPDKFDCSGFVSWSLSKSGVRNIGTNAQGLYNASTPVSRENARPGDLIFFKGTYSTHNTVTHVGIYIGNGMMIHAGKPVQYASIDTRYWTEHFYSFGRITG